MGVAAAVVWSFEFLRRSFMLPFVVLWARLRREDILDNEKRGMLHGYLAANPGANYEAIRGDLGMGMGTLAYHLRVLETEGMIVSWRDGRFRRYALRGHRAAETQPRLTDMELLLLQSLRRTPEITQRELAAEAGVSQPAISYHMRKMEEIGVVRAERRGLRRQYSVDLDRVPRDAATGGGGDAPRDGPT